MKALKFIALLGLIAISVAITTTLAAISFKAESETNQTNYTELLGQAKSNYEGYVEIKSVNQENLKTIDVITSDLARSNNNINNLNKDVISLNSQIDDQAVINKEQAESISVLQEHAKVYFHAVDSLRITNKDISSRNTKLMKEYKVLVQQLKETKHALNYAHKKEADREKIYGN